MSFRSSLFHEKFTIIVYTHLKIYVTLRYTNTEQPRNGLKDMLFLTASVCNLDLQVVDFEMKTASYVRYSKRKRSFDSALARDRKVKEK